MARKKATSAEKRRLDYKVAELKARVRKLFQQRAGGRRGPCDTEQAAYNAAVTVAAQKLIEWEDAQAVASSKETVYANAFGAACAAYLILDACLNPQ